LWLHSVKVTQLLRSAACLHTNQSRSYLNHLVFLKITIISHYGVIIIIIIIIIIISVLNTVLIKILRSNG